MSISPNPQIPCNISSQILFKNMCKKMCKKYVQKKNNKINSEKMRKKAQMQSKSMKKAHRLYNLSTYKCSPPCYFVSISGSPNAFMFSHIFCIVFFSYFLNLIQKVRVQRVLNVFTHMALLN